MTMRPAVPSPWYQLSLGPLTFRSGRTDEVEDAADDERERHDEERHRQGLCAGIDVKDAAELHDQVRHRRG